MRAYRFLFFMALTIGIALLSLSGLLRPLADGGRRITLPFMRHVAYLVQRVTQVAENASMQDKEARWRDRERRWNGLTVQQAQLQALKEENDQLRIQAKFLRSSGFVSVGGRVISRDVRGTRALLLIDRGRHDGVEIGQPVLIGDGIFIGKISALQERVSTVMLLTDPNSRVAVSPLDQKRLVGVLEGRGNGATVLTYIPSSEHLKRDQILVTAGTEEKVPQNLPVGVINSVEGKTTDPFLTASVDPLVSLDRILLVSVLHPETPSTPSL